MKRPLLLVIAVAALSAALAAGALAATAEEGRTLRGHAVREWNGRAHEAGTDQGRGRPARRRA